MDSSICLALAIKKFGANQVLSLSFRYEQRHSVELQQATQICLDWQVDHEEINFDILAKATSNALIGNAQEIVQKPNQPPNTLVLGRNGLIAQLCGVYAYHVNASCIYLGVLELETANSGYRDCSRYYMDLIQQVLRLDLGNPNFEVHTPLVHMTKKETLLLAYQLGLLEYLLKVTITCYNGLSGKGCQTCPACDLRNEGINQFLAEYPEFIMPYSFL